MLQGRNYFYKITASYKGDLFHIFITDQSYHLLMTVMTDAMIHYSHCIWKCPSQWFWVWVRLSGVRVKGSLLLQPHLVQEQHPEVMTHAAICQVSGLLCLYSQQALMVHF